MSMNNDTLTREQRLRQLQTNVPKDLVSLFEGVADYLYDFTDIRSNPGGLYDRAVYPVAVDKIMESVEPIIESIDYGEGSDVMLEDFEGDGVGQMVTSHQLHEQNMRQLLENSATEARVANANQFNLNQLTPFDAFLPFTIIRSYLPLIGKDLMPTITPPQPFIRIKQEYKYVVTKDGTRYLRPDVYANPDEVQTIIDSARGPKVTSDWYPAGTEATDGNGDYEDADGNKFTCPDNLRITQFDLLAESGGMIQIGDDLSIDVCVDGIRAVVENEDGTKEVIEQVGYEAYPDITSISPQRSISFDVKLPITDDEGNLIKIVEDRVYGDFNASTKTFNLTSLYGHVRQVQFSGHLSNKNNMEYFSFTNEFGVTQHPIPEGIRSNVPITVEDMQLYQETASIDIVATAINEMTEIFTQLEDTSILKKINVDYDKWTGKDVGEHPFEHMRGPVVFNKEVSVKLDSTHFLKRNQYVQDEIQYHLSRFIGDMRNTLYAEPFRLVAYAHPNICSLFVGDNIDWKITPGSMGVDSIRTDYRMGIYTANGDSFRLLSTLKCPEEDGIRFLIFPVNEQNFLSWKHFKHSMYFDRDHRNPQVQLVPNVMGISKFHTHSYTPLQAKFKIVDYK